MRYIRDRHDSAAELSWVTGLVVLRHADAKTAWTIEEPPARSEDQLTRSAIYRGCRRSIFRIAPGP